MREFSIFHRNISLANMLQPSGKLFHPITVHDPQIINQSDFLIQKNSFFTVSNQGVQSEILLGLSDNFLFANWKNNTSKVNTYSKLAFGLKFQLLRKEWANQKTPGIPYGIRFEKDKNHDVVEVFSNHPEVVNQWGLALERKINQRNFHQLFKAKKRIGKGAFATVYLAERLTDKKLVAVKAFSKEKQYSGDKGKQSLENEIKIMRGIDHKNITKLEGVYETENSIYVILECMEGNQLNEELKNGRVYNLEECNIIIKQILSALKHLNSRKVIHRDLKPENIMFKNPKSLELGICDFGLATYANEENYLFVRCGTPGFVAPEIINIRDMRTKSEPISDVFSAGIIFHYLLMGSSIFPAQQYNQVLSQNRSCQFNFQQPQYEKLPFYTHDLLKKMLEKNPNDRITAAAALKHPALHTDMEVQQDFALKENQNILGSLKQNNFTPMSKKSQVKRKQVNINQSQPSFFHQINMKKNISYSSNTSQKYNAHLCFKKML